MPAEYKALPTTAQRIYGTEVLNSIEVDAHGLMLDCNFVGLTGQASYFLDKGNLSGFEPKMKTDLDMAVSWDYAKKRLGFEPNDFDYEKIAGLVGMKYIAPAIRERISGESVKLFPDSSLDEKTIVSFTITFEPNQEDFSADRYGAEFERAIKTASTFGNCVVVVRGHSDPTKTLVDLLKAGMAKGTIQQTGSKGSYKYYLEGKELDLNSTARLVELIKSGGLRRHQPEPPRHDAGRLEPVPISGVGRPAEHHRLRQEAGRESGHEPDTAGRGGHLGASDCQAQEHRRGQEEHAG
jgi:hypothetical protein